MQQKWLVIINPASGGGKGAREWPKISKLLQEQELEHDPIFTEYEKHAITIAQEAILKGYKNIIVCGGDGTLNEVANGVLTQIAVPSQEITIGKISIGKGNDWARGMKLPKNYKKAIAHIKKGRTIIQDVGLVKTTAGERYFVNMSGTGFDGFVADKVNKIKKKGYNVGKVTYLLHVFLHLMQYKANPMQIKIDEGQVSHPVLTLAVGILPYNGGGMMQTPGALPDDGLFDLTIIKDITRFDILKEIKNLFTGTFIKHKKVDVYQCQQIEITSSPEVAVEVDGESFGTTPCSYSIIPSKLKVISGR